VAGTATADVAGTLTEGAVEPWDGLRIPAAGTAVVMAGHLAPLALAAEPEGLRLPGAAMLLPAADIAAAAM
jgi:hypothetical protein